MKKLKLLDLFSGLGGFSLGLERTGHFKTVAFCDNDKYSRLILDKHWKGTKVYEDIKQITKEQFDADGIEYPDIITGGFPCQPFSIAGKQKGTSDDRHLWPEMFRIIKTFQPRFVIGENVRGIVNIQDGLVFETVCTDLESEGYEVQPFNIPAAGVGAPHRRERIWFIAVREDVANTVSNDERREISRSYEEERRIQEEHRQNNSTTGKSSRTSEIRNGDNGYETTESNVADTHSSNQRTGKKSKQQEGNTSRECFSNSSEYDVSNTIGERGRSRITERENAEDVRQSPKSSNTGWWHVEPNVGRVAHGISGRVYRLKGLGNSIVPQIAEEIGKAIIKSL